MLVKLDNILKKGDDYTKHEIYVNPNDVVAVIPEEGVYQQFCYIVVRGFDVDAFRMRGNLDYVANEIHQAILDLPCSF